MESADRASSVAAALAGIPLPAGVAIRPWAETDFPTIQTFRMRKDGRRRAPAPMRRSMRGVARGPRSSPLPIRALIAFVRALTDGEVTMFVPELLVAPAWQGKGLGRCLLDVCHLLYPHVRIELFATESSASFYAAHGFRPFPGYRKSYR